MNRSFRIWCARKKNFVVANMAAIIPPRLCVRTLSRINVLPPSYQNIKKARIFKTDACHVKAKFIKNLKT